MVRSLVLVVCLAALAAHATSVPQLTPAQVAAKSDVVVQGTVVARETAWVGRRIFTFVTVRVDSTLRGALLEDEQRSGLVVVALHGGTVGALSQKVAGTPVLVDGARYDLCLSPATGPRGARGVMFFFEGAWRVDVAHAPDLEAQLRGDP